MTAAPDARAAATAPARRPALPSLTGLRFVAATLVFFFHASFWDPPQNPFADRGIGDAYQAAFSKAGWMGVSFFFVLSGFILTWTWRPQPRTAFWRRRAAKIFPTHIVMWLLAMLLYAAWTTPWPAALLNLFLLHSWSPDHATYISVNPPSWSLCSELLFYFLFPFLIPWIQRLREAHLWPVVGALVLGMVIAELVVQVAVPSLPRTPEGFPISSLQFWLGYNFPPMRLFEFVLGMVVARIVVAGRWPAVRPAAAVGLLVAAYLIDLRAPFLFSLTVVLIVPLLLVVGSFAAADLSGRTGLMATPAFQWLGDISFGFYMAQYVLMYSVRTKVMDARLYSTPVAVLVLLGFFLATVLAGWALHTLVERPAMRHFGAREAPRLFRRTSQPQKGAL